MKKLFLLVLFIAVTAVIFTSCNDGKTEDTAEESTFEITESETVADVTTAEETTAEEETTDEESLAPGCFAIPKEFVTSREISLDVIFGKGCVLQANMPIRVWGTTALTCEKLAAVVINENDGSRRTFYGDVKDGEFEIWFDATDYGGPYSITVTDEDGLSKTVTDVLFGEVYILAGQSNMEWTVGQCYGKNTSTNIYSAMLKDCTTDQIREMTVLRTPSDEPLERLTKIGKWTKVTPTSVNSMSAVGYFFARRLREALDVPVGLVWACKGGIMLTEWMKSGQWYNGQIAPITNLVARGVIWYQGEGDPDNYAERLAEMINQWRTEFENSDMLFHVIQLPRFEDADKWYKCREEDKKVCSLVANCTYSVNIDTGLFPEFKAEGDPMNDNGIHPYQKLEVGYRAADVLLEKYYKLEGCRSSTYMTSVTRGEGNTVLIKYENVGEGLTLKGLAGFEAAGADGKFIDVKPTLVDKNTVSVTWDRSEEIVTVRYGYTNSSKYIEGDLSDCSRCVCVYNTVNGQAAYPGEQFTETVK